MQVERTFSGFQATLRLRGVARFVGAAFLFVWLCGWTFGEGFALWILFAGAKSLLTGQPPEPGRSPLELAPALATGLFLIAWLTLWTFGGIAAWYELMRLLFSRDRLRVTGHGLEITRRVGVFSSTRRLPRTQLRRIYCRAGSVVMVETVNESVELTRNARLAETDELVRLLSAELNLEASKPLPPALPPDWREITVAGRTLLVKDPLTRRKQAILAWLVALPLCVTAALCFRDAIMRNPGLYGLGAVVGAFALPATWGAWRLAFTRVEWELQPGRLIQQRRRGSKIRVLFEGRVLVVDSSRDSDGDIWYAAGILAPTTTQPTGREKRRSRRNLVKQMHDSTEPRRLAEWIAGKTGMPVFPSMAAPEHY
jgi:hypothetical protein